jgi:putative transcriptional regulator
MSELVNRLRALRESTGMTQADLAAALGVSRQTIISIEQGRYSPSLDLALRLARLFGRPVEELFQLPD